MLLGRKWSQGGKQDSRGMQQIREETHALSKTFILRPLCQIGWTLHFASWQFLLVEAKVRSDRPPDRFIHSPLLAEPVTKKSTGNPEVRALEVRDQELRERKHRRLYNARETQGIIWVFQEFLETRELTILAAVCPQCHLWALLLRALDLEESSSSAAASLQAQSTLGLCSILHHSKPHLEEEDGKARAGYTRCKAGSLSPPECWV